MSNQMPHHHLNPLKRLLLLLKNKPCIQDGTTSTTKEESGRLNILANQSPEPVSEEEGQQESSSEFEPNDEDDVLDIVTSIIRRSGLKKAP
ncbi:hypothetical protein A2U01_0062520, partial [Trifolium medium]|nr:hypothetical protein [Trifolium medium]